MSKNNRVKQGSAPTATAAPVISTADKEQMRELYKIRAYAANGVFLTPIMQGNSTLIRLTFTEHNLVVSEHIPVTAISMSLENVVNIYNALGKLMNQMKVMGRIA